MAQLQRPSEFPQSFNSYNMYYDNQDTRPSRLPRPTQQRRPSKLEMLQSDYQKKLLREKEAKLIDMYERQQEQAIRKVSGNSGKRGIVRDFFEERRAMEKQGSASDLPSMTAHFKQKKWEREQQYQDQRKASVGVNRGNPLAPINARRKAKSNPGPTYSDHHNGYNYEDKIPTPPISRKPKLVRNYHRKQSPADYYDQTPPYSDEDIPPPRGNLRNLHDKKKKEQKSDKQKGKLSDFQKWQKEQDLQRQKRLEKLKQKQDMFPDSEEDQNFDDDFVETPHRETRKPGPKVKAVLHDKIKQKELELQLMIEQQQLEIEQVREEEEKASLERKKRQEQRLREERLRRIKQEEERLEKQHQAREIEDEPTDDYSLDSYRPSPEPEPIRYTKPKPKKTVKRPPPPPKEPDENIEPYFKNEKDNFYATVEDDEAGIQLNLKSCPSCGRKFAADRLSKHTKVCKQTINKKRKVFDPVKNRTAGTELEKYIRQGKHLEDGPKPKASNWRRKHEDFVRAIRDARKFQAHVAQGGKASDLPPPAPSSNPDYKQCPYCKRRFNPDTADRHIPKCKDIKARPAPPKRR
ncbi:uncharacterized protein LOC144452393 [Glandiceps talaboti]